LVIMKLMNVN